MNRIGIGYDLHRLEEDRPLIIGGMHIPHEKGLVGHSDADVLCHAITDALLGAMAMGDIGAHFPDNDPRYKGADSMELLKVTMNLVRSQGFRVGNVDTVVVAQRPKLRDHISGMRQTLAEVLGVTRDRVSVKAKTNEHVGPEGREEAISAQAVVILEHVEP